MIGPTKAQMRVAVIELIKGLRSLRGLTGSRSYRAARIDIELNRAARNLGLALRGYQYAEELLRQLHASRPNGKA